MKRTIYYFLLIFLFLSIPVLAEVTGTIQFTTINASVTTGLFAYTVKYCNTTSNCLGLKCFNDYDSTSSGATSGWCNFTSIASCYHNDSEYGSGTSVCTTNTTYRTCSSANWSIIYNCSTGYRCDTAAGTPGNCTIISSSTSSSGSGGSTTTNATDKTPSLIFTSAPSDFDIVQGSSVIKYVSVKNNGNQTLYNITLSVSGLSWATVSPGKFNYSYKNNETTFTINFTAPENADIKTYTATLEVRSHNASVSRSLKINVKPSAKTVQEQIFPEYELYISTLADLESKMLDLEVRGADVEEVKVLLLNAKNKLQQANRSLESKDYSEAKNLLDDIKGLLDGAAEKISSITIKPPEFKIDTWLLVTIIVIVCVAVLVIYMLLPPKPKPSTIVKPWSKKK